MEVTKFTDMSMKDKTMITFDKIGNILDNINLTREEKIVANAHASDIFASFTSVQTSELNNSLKLLLNSVKNPEVRLGLSEITRELVVLHTKMTLFKEAYERESSLTEKKATISIAKVKQIAETKNVIKEESISQLKRVGVSIAVTSVAGVLSYYTLKTQKQAVTNILKMLVNIFIEPSSPGMCKKTIMKQVTSKAIDENALSVIQKIQRASGYTVDLPMIDIVSDVSEIVDSTDMLCAATSYVYNPVSSTVKYFVGDLPSYLGGVAVKTGNVLIESGDVATDLVIVLFTIVIALVFFVGCLKFLQTSIKNINIGNSNNDGSNSDAGSKRKSSRVSRKSKKPVKKSKGRTTRQIMNDLIKAVKNDNKSKIKKLRKEYSNAGYIISDTQLNKMVKKSTRKSKKSVKKSTRKSVKKSKKSTRKSVKKSKKSTRKSVKKYKKSTRKSKKSTKKSKKSTKKPAKKSTIKSKKPAKKSTRKSKKPVKKSTRKSKKSVKKSTRKSKKSVKKSKKPAKK